MSEMAPGMPPGTISCCPISSAWILPRCDTMVSKNVHSRRSVRSHSFLSGMGNRFRDLPFYHDLVRAHGILAAITFLFIVPAAIFVLRFYWRDSRLAIRIHIWLQILTVLLSTVILVLGYFSVGPERSLTNPHHGIGVAIYVLIMFQAIWGALVRRWERKRTIWRVSVKLLVCIFPNRCTNSSAHKR